MICAGSLLFLLPVVLFSMYPGLSPFYSARNKKWWTTGTWPWLLFLFFSFLQPGLAVFLTTRLPLDAGAMNFVEDSGISLKMMLQTYPMVLDDTGIGGSCIFFPVDVSPQSLAGDQ